MNLTSLLCVDAGPKCSEPGLGARQSHRHHCHPVRGVRVGAADPGRHHAPVHLGICHKPHHQGDLTLEVGMWAIFLPFVNLSSFYESGYSKVCHACFFLPSILKQYLPGFCSPPDLPSLGSPPWPVSAISSSLMETTLCRADSPIQHSPD